jgi:hypothetical protein
MLRFARSLVVVAFLFATGMVMNQNPAAYAITFPYIQNFDTDTANAAATYPEFTLVGSGPATVSGGVLHLGLDNSNNFNFPSVSTTPGLSTDIVLEVDMGGINPGIGSSRAEIKLGGVNALFHVGYPGGAFRFEGNVSQPNTDMGYSPATGVLHHFTARSYGNGQFDVAIRNGSNPLQVFNASFNDVPSVGQPFGLRYLSTGTGIFDNLSVHYAANLVDNSNNSVISVGSGTSVDKLLLSNGGLNASVLNVTSFSISGVGAGFFDLPDFAPTSLTVGGSNSVGFDVAFSGGEGLTLALLTLHTNIGDFEFTLSGQAAPEPSSLVLLGLGSVLVARRKKKSSVKA